jgi:hypothetical protein
LALAVVGNACAGDDRTDFDLIVALFVLDVTLGSIGSPPAWTSCPVSPLPQPA